MPVKSASISKTLPHCLTDEVHVIGADVFVDRALSAEGEPANQAHFRQMIQRAVDGRRSDTFQIFQNLVCGEVTTPGSQYV